MGAPVLKLGKLADYATMVMTVLAAEAGRPLSAHELAGQTHLAEPTVAKVLKLLSRGGVVRSERGAQGGYRLARPAARITVADIITAIDGPIAVTRCSTHGGGCAVESSCGVRGNWRLIGKAIRAALEAVTLEQMAQPLRQSRDAPVVVTLHPHLKTDPRPRGQNA